MTKLLEQAVARAKALPPDLQDIVAASLLADIEGELQWDDSLSQSGERLTQLAEEALREDESGTSLPLDPDAL